MGVFCVRLCVWAFFLQYGQPFLCCCMFVCVFFFFRLLSSPDCSRLVDQKIDMEPGNRVILSCVGGKDSYAVFEAANDDAAAVLFVGELQTAAWR